MNTHCQRCAAPLNTGGICACYQAWPQLSIQQACVHCWCEPAEYPENHAQCCRCYARMHYKFLPPEAKPAQDEQPCYICGSTAGHETETRRFCSRAHPWDEQRGEQG
jgi:hypothetical protein